MVKKRFQILSKKSPHHQSGQAVVEYVLLMVITVSLALLIVKQLASRTPGEEGLIVAKWNQILTVIGKDNPEDPSQ